MYCEQCGLAAKPTDKYCHNCGHQLQAQVIESSPIPRVESPESHPEQRSTITTQSEESAGVQVIESVPPKVTEPEIHQESSAEATDASKKFFGAHHPWRRYFARTVDMALAVPLLYLVLFYSFGGKYPFAEFILGTDRALDLLGQPFVILLLLFILWAPIEAVFLSAFGATFGKWAFGVRVQDSDGNRLSYGKAFVRAFGVLVYGLGLGIPFVNMITCLFSYRKLTKTGTTEWDDDDKLLVSHQPWTPVKGLICAFAVFLTLMSGVLTPLVVAKLNTGYWASRASLPPLASPPNAVQSRNVTEAVEKQGKLDTSHSAGRADLPKQVRSPKVVRPSNESGTTEQAKQGTNLGAMSAADVHSTCKKAALTV